jgi:hypothetical protein
MFLRSTLYRSNFWKERLDVRTFLLAVQCASRTELLELDGEYILPHLHS